MAALRSKSSGPSARRARLLPAWRRGAHFAPHAQAGVRSGPSRAVAYGSDDTGHDERPPAHHPDPARLQPPRRRRDAGGLCAALHRQEGAALEPAGGGADRARLDLVPGPGSDRRHAGAGRGVPQHARRGAPRRRADLRVGRAHHRLRRPPRRRYGPAHPRRGLRLSRLDGDLADLCELHLPVPGHRSRDHGPGPATLFRPAALARLHRLRRPRHPAGGLRHPPHQPLPDLDAAGLDRAQPPAARLHRGKPRRPGLPRHAGGLPRPRRGGSRRVRSAALRPRHQRAPGAPRPGRRAGRFFAVRASGQGQARSRLVGGGAGRRRRLDRARHAQDPARGLPRRTGARPRHPGAAGRRADADVRGRLRLRLALAGGRAPVDGRFRRPVADQDQPDQRLCRLDRVVELLLAPHPQPSGPRGLARLQRRHRPDADGTRHRQDDREHAAALRRRRLGLGRGAGLGSGRQQAARAVAAGHRVQARPSLRGQSGRHRGDGARPGAGLARLCRRVREPRFRLRAAAGAGRRVRGRPADRLGHGRALLHRAAARPPAGRRRDRLPGLRAAVRGRGHGAVPRL